MTKFSRREFVRSTAVAGAALAVSKNLLGQTHERQSSSSPIRFGLASYTFRNFSRAQMIAFMKQLNVSDLNAKELKDHLPFDQQQESAALADYAAANIKLHAAGVISLA